MPESDRSLLDREMRSLLAQLATCSHVPAAAWGPSGRSRSSDEPLGGNRPPGDLGSTIYAQLYGVPFFDPEAGAPAKETMLLARMLLLQSYPRTDDECRTVIRAARAELEHLRGRAHREPPREETLAERNGRIIKDGEGFPAREVAVRFRCSEREVRRAREAAGLEPDYGRVPHAERLASDERRTRARALAASGHTLAQITRLTGASRSTVERDLGRRAA